ncbi:RDD family protein [Mangrovactinospora gilvigrisea]|uniref:RDD family protein n=1 Tax=Mangrovactinospora gilvigrisea TaxID=1428644 RepID=UPI001587F26A|nr:RDD family protein [Mangrovactinospora gilvigrisea]
MPGPSSPFGAYAGWGARLGAYIIDSLIVGVIPGVLYIIGASKLVSAVLKNTKDGTQINVGSAITFMVIGIVVLLALLLLLGWREGVTGRSPGKAALHIRVVNLYDGGPSGGGLGMGRWLCRYTFNGILLLGFLWPLWDEQKQSWADKICNTIVLKDA